MQPSKDLGFRESFSVADPTSDRRAKLPTKMARLQGYQSGKAFLIVLCNLGVPDSTPRKPIPNALALFRT